jgi:hypothetical protein
VPVRITYTNIADDYIALQRYQLEHAPSWVRWTRFLRIPLAIFVVVMLFTIWKEDALWYALIATGILVSWLLLILGRDWLLAWLSERYLRRMEREKDKPANAEYFREYDLELDGGRLIEHKPRGAFGVSVKAITQVISTPENTFLLGPVHNYVIPRRAGREGEYDRFVETLQHAWLQSRT